MENLENNIVDNEPIANGIKRNWVISNTDYGDLVGVYVIDDNNNETLICETSPEKADAFIKFYDDMLAGDIDY